VREGDWKLLCDFDGSQPWLYHLKEDPGETINRATQEPEVMARLTQVVLTWNASMPQDNSVALGKEPPPSSGGKRKKQ
jgi:hypothetical protein